MSRRSSTSAKGAKKKGQAADPDVYVAMLFVSVASLTWGIVFLVMECQRYNWLVGK